MLSINQIKVKLNDLASSHAQINSFYFGDFSALGASEFQRYPVMAVDLQPGTISKGIVSSKFVLVFADKVFDDDSNKTEVLSDQQLIALDIYAQLQNYLDTNNISLASDATMTDFSEKWDDCVAGFQIEVNIEQFFSRDTCQVPSTFDPQSDLGTVTIYDQDGNVVTTLNAGQSYTVIVASGVDEGSASQTYAIQVMDVS